MSANQNSTPIYSGEFCHALDPKNRITVPARWRSSEADELYLVDTGSTNFLRAMPRAEFEAVEDKVNQSPGITAQEKRIFLRNFYSSSEHVVLDKQGRLLVPEKFGKKIGLEGDAVLVGTHKTFEIWNPKAWAETKQNDASTFAKVADVLGF